MINNIDQLKKVLKYAYDEVDYYHDIFDEYGIDIDEISKIDDLKYLPALTKEIAQNQTSNMISREYNKFPKNQFIDVRRTSGSSGKFLKIYWDKRYDIKSLMSLWRARNYWYSINPNMKFCSFYTVAYLGNKLVNMKDKFYNYEGRNLIFQKTNLTKDKLKEIYKILLEYNPDWFNMQPSIVILLADVINDYDMEIPSNLKYIELSGEMLPKSTSLYIEETFKIKPTNQYGTSETNGIAIECECGNMHILEDNVIVEILKDGQPVINEEGDIHVTSLYSYAMPFIRYDTGDTGIISNEKCHCGRHSKLLKLTSGRNCDFITLKNEQKISSYTLSGIIEKINEYSSNAIKQFQIIEKSQENFNLKLVLKTSYKGWEKSIIETFNKNIKMTELSYSNWNFEFVDSIFVDNITGKTKYFISMLNERSMTH